jgi:hypothetical protein
MSALIRYSEPTKAVAVAAATGLGHLAFYRDGGMAVGNGIAMGASYLVAENIVGNMNQATTGTESAKALMSASTIYAMVGMIDNPSFEKFVKRFILGVVAGEVAGVTHYVTNEYTSGKLTGWDNSFQARFTPEVKPQTVAPTSGSGTSEIVASAPTGAAGAAAADAAADKGKKGKGKNARVAKWL